MTIRRKLDIEATLRFAYRDELPKRGNVASTAAGGQWERITKVGLYGTAIDEGWPEPGFPAALGDPHPDALRVEQAVRGLDAISQAELADESITEGLQGFGIDAAPHCSRAMGNLANLVAIHARLGSRPDWGGAMACERVNSANGKARVVRQEPWWVESEWKKCADKRGRPLMKPVKWVEMTSEVEVAAIRAGVYPDGAYCCIAWSPAPHHLVRDRAEYAVWWAALDYLANELSGQLASIDVLPLAAAQRPWLGEQDRTTRIHIKVETKARAMA